VELAWSWRTWRNAGTQNYSTLCSEWKGKCKKTNERMKIPVEAVCIMIPSDSKGYGYSENLSYIIFNMQKCWCYIEIVDFYIRIRL